MNRRQFFGRLVAVAGVAAAAPVIAKVVTSSAPVDSGMSLRGMPVLVDQYAPRGTIILMNMRKASAYRELLEADRRYTMADMERASEPFWRSQR